MTEFKKLYNQLKEDLKSRGYKKLDVHLKRKVLSLSGIHIEVDGSFIDELRNKEVLKKYKQDWKRMKPTFELAIKAFNSDLFSRQLLILNVDNYSRIKECFQLMQFVFDDDSVRAIVYQRSADLVKLQDDLIFFVNIISKFEKRTGHNVTKLSIIYGDFHCTTK